MHRRGIYHCDIKLDNVLVINDTFLVKLCDFGLASHISDSLKSRQTRRGTPGYLGPELFASNGFFLGEKSDIFSLGALFYNLLSGGKLSLVIGSRHKEIMHNNINGNFNSL